MRKGAILSVVILIVSCLSQPAVANETAIYNANGSKAFAANKEFVIKADKLLRKFTSNRTSTDDAIAMLDDAQSAVQYGTVAINNLEKELGDLKNFERVNPEAKKMRLAAKVKGLKKKIKKAEKEIQTLSKRLEKRIKDEVDMLAKYGKVKTAGKYLTRIREYFALLEKTGGAYVREKEAVMQQAQTSYDKIMAKAASNKLPKNGYAGSGRSSLEKEIARVYQTMYRSQPTRVVIISSDWEEEKTYRIQNNVITEKITKYVYAHVAVKKGSSYTVYIMGFGREKVPGGKYGKLGIFSIGNNYPVMANNINK